MNLHSHSSKLLCCRSRRGSSAVFLCVILSALVSVCFAFIYSTIEYTTASRSDALLQLSADSLLSEFDRDIMNEYGLFLLQGDDRQFSTKLRHYLMYTFNQESSVRVSDVRASGASFTATDPSVIREQILAFTKAGGLLLRAKAGGSVAGGSGVVESVAGGSGVGENVAGGSGVVESAADGSAATDPAPRISDTDAGRALRHGPTISSLPSRQLPQQDLLTRAQAAGEQLSDISGIFSDGTDRYLLSSYVLHMFNCTTSTADPDHFFFRETEYILQGELTDRENLKKTGNALTMLRLSPNLIHIYSDQKKREALTAAAELITPGAAAALTSTVLATAWAYAESSNDSKLLMKGSLVPLMKDEASWAIDLDNVIRDTGDGDGVIRPKENKGLSYAQYLRILLSLQDEDLLTARILDLVQINTRKNTDGTFLIGACCTGLRLQAEVNERNYQYEKVYQRLLYR